MHTSNEPTLADHMAVAKLRARDMFDHLAEPLQPLRHAYTVTSSPGLTGKREEHDCYLVAVKRNEENVFLSVLFIAGGNAMLYVNGTARVFGPDEQAYEDCLAAAREQLISYLATHAEPVAA